MHVHNGSFQQLLHAQKLNAQRCMSVMICFGAEADQSLLFYTDRTGLLVCLPVWYCNKSILVCVRRSEAQTQADMADVTPAHMHAHVAQTDMVAELQGCVDLLQAQLVTEQAATAAADLSCAKLKTSLSSAKAHSFAVQQHNTLLVYIACCLELVLLYPHVGMLVVYIARCILSA